MAKTGRRPKLTPALQERLIDALVAGNYIETACVYSGLGISTYYKWIEQSNKPNARKDLIEFREAVERARAEAEVRNVSAINKIAKTNYQAAAWWLERSFPKRWGRQQSVELTGSGASINVTIDAREAVLQALRDRAEDSDES
jgi:hypothetical protein